MASIAKKKTRREDPHVPNNKDNGTPKDLMTFCMQLVHNSQWISDQMFYCGSCVEIGRQGIIMKYFDIDREKFDSDTMYYHTSRYAVHRSSSLPETYTGEILRIYTDDLHTGYVRLIREKDNTEVRMDEYYTLNAFEIKHGPAALRNYKSKYVKNKYSLSHDATDLTKSEYSGVASYDEVRAIHSPYWPAEATEWITRRRCHGFPSKSVIKQIVRYGCDFVQVSHNRLCNDGEWRYSFSKAELFLTKTWTISQKIVYTSLWILNKKIASSNLCTYYFKTLMFWACEEKTAEFWSYDLLIQSVCELLIEMTYWVKSRLCVNYFIPGNNMMDHLINTDLSCEIATLFKTYQSRQLITDTINSWRECDIILGNTTRCIESPSWIKRALIIDQRVHDPFNCNADSFSTDSITDLRKALYVELSDIYRGLCFQRTFINCLDLQEKQIHFLKSESHFLFTLNLCKSQDRDVINNCSDEFEQLMMRQFIKCDTDGSSEVSSYDVELKTKRKFPTHRQNSSTDYQEQKCMLYSRAMEIHENTRVNFNLSQMLSESRNINITTYMTTEIYCFPHTAVEFHKEWPGQSPTVNFSWFIAKAYLANLYYSAQCDVSLTIKTCDDIIEVYRQSFMNQMFAEKAFRVALSTQWSSIYDKEIQELLGFYSLFSYVFNPSYRSMYFCVCPVQFAHYVKIRAWIYHTSKHWLVRNDMFLVFVKYDQDYKEHLQKNCRSNDETNNGSVILGKALLQAFKNITRHLSLLWFNDINQQGPVPQRTPNFLPILSRSLRT